MAYESKPTYKGKVTLGTNSVLGMGTWQHSGLSRAMLDDTEFGDKVEAVLPDILNGGQVSFNGNFKADDTQGHDKLHLALMNGSPITDIRFYYNASSYYMPNNTSAAGGGVPASYPISRVFVMSHDIDFSGPKGNLGKSTFAVKVDGVMRKF